jgi:hypothetical protein
MLVSGVIWCCYGDPDIRVTKIDQPVAFIRETDAIFSDDRWMAVVNYNLTPYEAVVSALRENLLATEKLVDQSTFIGELHRVESMLHSLEEKLDNIKRFLPRNLKKRGIFDLGGTALKY